MIAASQPALYTSRIIKAGALLPDTRLMLEAWDSHTSIPDNLARFQGANLFGKASRSRVKDVLAIFRRRYLGDPQLLEALTILVQGRMAGESLDRVLYFQTARSDRLLHDFVIDVLLPLSNRPNPEISRGDVDQWIADHVATGKTESPWSPVVQERVSQGLLATLRDFGILEGAVRKRVAFAHLSLDAFAFIAIQLALDGSSAERLLHHPDWKLFLLTDQVIERFFLEAHQERLLQYHAAGRVVRIDFPVASLSEYARVLTQRAHVAT